MVFELYLSKGVMRKSYCFRKEREREEEREKTDFSFFLWRLVDKDVVPGGAATIRHVEGLPPSDTWRGNCSLNSREVEQLWTRDDVVECRTDEHRSCPTSGLHCVRSFCTC